MAEDADRSLLVGRPHHGTKRERTLAITWGPWGGVWFCGKRRLVWRLCLGFVAITYVPMEMTQILEAWLECDYPDCPDGPCPCGSYAKDGFEA